MSMSSSVVPGEAPESDDEGQLDQLSENFIITPRSIVCGEAPESTSSSECQEELSKQERLDCATKATASTPTSPSASTSATPVADVREKVLRTIRAQRKESTPSLLVTKLRENNISLRNSVVDFVRQTVLQTNKEINTINNDLLRSQMTLQEAITAYRQMNKNIKDIDSALSLSPSLNGIPKIDIRTII